MTYSATSAISGAGRATAAQINAWMAARGRRLAGQYAPDGRYVAPPASLGDDILRACRRWAPLINQDIVAAQIAHETAGWQSEFARSRNNPAGLGAINSDPGQAIRFATPYDGVLAQVAHLLAYAVGDGPWRDSDPRFAAVRSAGWLGAAPTLAGLDGRWAYPGQGYGATLARLADDLLTTDGGAMGGVAKPPVLTDRRSPNMDGYGTPRRVEAAVEHIANGTLAGTLSWFSNAASMASSNYLIAEDGTIYEVVPPDHSPWTNGQVAQPDTSNPLIAAWARDSINPNTRTVTIEHVGQTTDGRGGALSEAQWASSIWLNAWLSQEFGYPADREHIIGHYQIDRVSRGYCPGFSAAEWERLITGVAALLAGPAADALYLVNADGSRNPYPVRLGFRSWCEAQGRARGVSDLNAAILSVTGYPLGAEYPTATGSAQEFERLTLVWTRDAVPPWDIVPLFRSAEPPARAA